MSTRGSFGFHENGKDELYYNHWDSYPDGLGAAFINFLKGKDEDNWITDIMSDPDARNDYFILDSLFCEYAYIFNKDTNELEVYCGFQKKPPKGRYHDFELREGYYACGLITAIHMDTINHYTTKELIDFIEEEEEEEERNGGTNV